MPSAALGMQEACNHKRVAIQVTHLAGEIRVPKEGSIRFFAAAMRSIRKRNC